MKLMPSESIPIIDTVSFSVPSLDIAILNVSEDHMPAEILHSIPGEVLEKTNTRSGSMSMS